MSNDEPGSVWESVHSIFLQPIAKTPKTQEDISIDNTCCDSMDAIILTDRIP